MVDIKHKTKGILGTIIGIMLTVFGYYLFPAMADLMPITALKVIYWVGILMYWISCVVILPLIMILGEEGDFKGVVKGLIVFLSGMILSLGLYYTIPPILEALNGISPNNVFTGIGWFAVYTCWVLGMIVLPTGVTLKDTVLKGKLN